MVTCCVPTCDNSDEESDAYSFFVFPNNRTDCQTWTKIIRRKLNIINWVPPKDANICEQHFEDECFVRTLAPGSIPTIFESKCEETPVTKKRKIEDTHAVNTVDDIKLEIVDNIVDLDVKAEVPTVEKRTLDNEGAIESLNIMIHHPSDPPQFKTKVIDLRGYQSMDENVSRDKTRIEQNSPIVIEELLSGTHSGNDKNGYCGPQKIWIEVNGEFVEEQGVISSLVENESSNLDNNDVQMLDGDSLTTSDGRLRSKNLLPMNNSIPEPHEPHELRDDDDNQKQVEKSHLVRFGNYSTGIYSTKSLASLSRGKCNISHEGSNHEATLINSNGLSEIANIEEEGIQDDPSVSPGLSCDGKNLNTEVLPTSLKSTGLNSCDDNLMQVKKSRGRNGSKKNFCVFCHTKQMKIARHLEVRHRDEPDVIKFSNLPKKSTERLKIIDRLRKQGNFLFNTNQNFNDGELIVCRRPKVNNKKTAEDFMACGNCKAYLSKNSLRAHFKKCSGKSSKNRRVAMLMSRKVMGRIHERASKRVREDLFPTFREDEVIRAIRYDEIVILYCNKMVDKYKNSRHFEMIRHKIRLIGRFLLSTRQLNTKVTDLKSVFDPKYIDDAAKSINIAASLKRETNFDPARTSVFHLTRLLKQIGSILINECIKNRDNERKVKAENFLDLLGKEVNIDIDKTITESQSKEQTGKAVELPSRENINQLYHYLSRRRNVAYKDLIEKFSIETWTVLCETTLISIQLFNSRPAEEVERILIDDFKTYEGIVKSENEKIIEDLSEKNQILTKKYVRFFIRGNRNIPVLLDPKSLECVKLIIENREKANVNSNNPYVFGVNSIDNSRHKYFKVCDLMRKFCNECGVANPERFCDTKLQRHIATTCIPLNVWENQVSHLSHTEIIHAAVEMPWLLGIELDADHDESEDSNDNEADNLLNHEVCDDGIAEDKGSRCRTARKRSTSPCGRIKRVKWSEDEKEMVLSKFDSNLKSKKLPSLREIGDFIAQCPVLQNRTPPQVKTWIHNQFRMK